MPAEYESAELVPVHVELEQDVEDLFAEDDGLCHLRDPSFQGTWVTLCRVSPTWKVAGHTTGTPDAPFCSGCGRPRCPECAALWRGRNGAA